MSEVDKHETLLHKLSYHQDSLKGIFDLPCNNMHVKLAAIERKIVAIEELVLELPYGDETTSFEEWRLTVSELYRRFFQLVSEKKKKPEKAVSSGKATKDGSTHKDASSNEEVETGNVSPATAGTVTSSDNPKSNKKRSQSTASGTEQGNGGRASQGLHRPGPVKQTYRNLSFRRTSGTLPISAEPAVEKSVEEQKEELKTQYDGFFSKLEPVAELSVDSDLEGMRILSLLVNRCIRQMTPFEDDSQLLSDLLNFALAKAPKTVIERYNSLNEEAEKEVEKDDAENEDESKRPPLKGLRLLKKCLVAELTDFYETAKAALVTEDGGDCAGGEATEGQNCYYCKSTGHYKFRCPQMRNQICFRCFKRGHKAKECGRRCFKCGLAGHYKKFCKA